MQVDKLRSDLLFGEIEKQRVTIIKEIGYKILALKNNIKTFNVISLLLNVAILILSAACAFGLSNYMLGLSPEISDSEINLVTNFWFFGACAFVLFAIVSAFRISVSSLYIFYSNPAKKFEKQPHFQKFVVFNTLICLIAVYVINLLYYKEIYDIFIAIFISFIFAGTLIACAVIAAFYKYRLKILQMELIDCEFRQDVESVFKNYRRFILDRISKLSENKIDAVKKRLSNYRFRMFIEAFIGLVTVPFLAYGVSNSLAMCFPESAYWLRLSGFRFSPVFLLLAIFFVIFAFLLFVKTFTLTKQIKGSESIKFDGFIDYETQGVTLFGLDSVRNLESERKFVLFLACFIIVIEFSMNISYYLNVSDGGFAGLFLSAACAFVPTLLLITQAVFLGSTIYKIKNCENLLDARA